MAAPGALFGSLIGPNFMSVGGALLSGFTTYAMAAQKACIDFRFMAKQTSDIYSVRLNWGTVTSAGTVQLRIETDSSGKASGSLYDANASYNITPASGIQTYTFSTPPNTGLVVGNEYHVLLITTVAGTTQTLTAYSPSGFGVGYPCNALTASDGTTRTNLAEVTNSVPVCSLVLSDGTEEVASFMPFYTTAISPIYTTNIVACKITTLSAIKVAGIRAVGQITGTPADALVIDIRDTANNRRTGMVVTLDKASLITGLESTTRPIQGLFPTPISLPPGTYYICFASSGSADSSNCWKLSNATFLNSACVGNPRLSTSTNSGTTMTDSTTAQAAAWLVEDVDVACTGGGLGVLGGPMQVSMG
jgi:hypothetical protein